MRKLSFLPESEIYVGYSTPRIESGEYNLRKNCMELSLYLPWRYVSSDLQDSNQFYESMDVRLIEALECSHINEFMRAQDDNQVFEENEI